MLPDIIAKELFNTGHRMSDLCIDFLCEKIESFSLDILQIDDNDHAVIIDFGKNSISGQLRIDRVFRTFDVVVRNGDVTCFPTRGDWNVVMNYLRSSLE